MQRAWRIIGIVQARTGSSRLPGKVIAPVCGRPLLEHLLKRVATSQWLTELVVATTTLGSDDCVAALADDLGMLPYRGSETDVLDRYYQAASARGADIIVRLTGDNPLVDGTFVDRCVDSFLRFVPSPDYLDTSSSKTYPIGLSVEVLGMGALEAAWRETQDPEDREHVTRFIRERGGRFRLRHLAATRNDSDLRWTVDTAEDLEQVRRIFEALDLDSHLMAYDELVVAVRAHPNLVVSKS